MDLNEKNSKVPINSTLEYYADGNFRKFSDSFYYNPSGVLTFVEVKLRNSNQYGKGVEAVDYNKRMRIQNAAKAYVREYGIENIPIRFDVIDIMRVKGKYCGKHYKNIIN